MYAAFWVTLVVASKWLLKIGKKTKGSNQSVKPEPGVVPVDKTAKDPDSDTSETWRTVEDAEAKKPGDGAESEGKEPNI